MHRIGRTARAGASGIAVSLLTGEDVHELKAIERLIGATLERHDLPDFDYEKRVILESQPGAVRARASWSGTAAPTAPGTRPASSAACRASARADALTA